MSEPAVIDPRRACATVQHGAGGDLHPGIEITIVQHPDAIESQWRQFEQEADCTAFQSFDWISAWCRHVGPLLRAQPAVVVGRLADGTLLFILPLAIMPGFVRRLTWLAGDLCDYNGPLLAGGFSSLVTPSRFATIWGDVLRRLQEEPATRFDLVDLTKMPERIGPQTNPCLALGTALNPSNAYVTDLFGTWDEFYHEKRSSATRRRDRSKLKRLAEWGEVRFVTPSDGEAVARTIDMLVEQKSRSFARMGVDNIFQRAGWSAFFAAIATERSPQSLVHVSRLDIGASWSAINLGLVHKDTYYHVLASHDDGEMSRFGPGVAHLRELLRYSIDRGLKHFDFTIGDERYKREWSDRTVLLYDHVAAASLRGHAAATVMNGQRRLKRAIKQNERLWSLVSRLRAAFGRSLAPPAGEPVTLHQSPPLAPK